MNKKLLLVTVAAIVPLAACAADSPAQSGSATKAKPLQVYSEDIADFNPDTVLDALLKTRKKSKKKPIYAVRLQYRTMLLGTL